METGNKKEFGVNFNLTKYDSNMEAVVFEWIEGNFQTVFQFFAKFTLFRKIFTPSPNLNFPNIFTPAFYTASPYNKGCFFLFVYLFFHLFLFLSFVQSTYIFIYFYIYYQIFFEQLIGPKIPELNGYSAFIRERRVILTCLCCYSAFPKIFTRDKLFIRSYTYNTFYLFGNIWYFLDFLFVFF